MKARCIIRASWLLFVCAAQSAGLDDAIKPSMETVPSPAAAQAILDQTAHETGLRLGPLDVFPHAAASATYDDNLLISHENRLSDVEWCVAPGFMVALGDVSSSLGGPVTLDGLRSLLYYSLADDQAKPRRFLGVDYTPAINLYTDHDQFNDVDQNVRLSGGYNLSRMTVGLDFDFFYGQVKDTGVGDLVTIANYETRLRTRYDLSEMTALELNGEYLRFDYINPQYQGYQDFRNQDWLDHQFGERLSAAVGAGVGYLEPETDPEQTYEQGLARAVYRLTGKSYLSASGGAEVRQFRTGASDAVRPVFNITGVFQPWVNTMITLEGHRREDAAPFQGENYIQLGASANVRQLVFNRCYVGLGGGYDNIEYTDIETDNSVARTDNYWFLTVNCDYEFHPRWTASVFYTYRRDDSSETSLSYYNNVVGVRVGWKY